MQKSHVFLGPSCELSQAKSLLPEACYHPPVQCGDIIRLFRLHPRRIIIIDGLYETTPSVWHKELLLALERGIEVWGAASMGALRAAELHYYGMEGFGEIYNNFKNGIWNDDDEVAVLHQSAQKNYIPINDAMVNIRATCQRAQDENVLTQEANIALVNHCKALFYPYRSLAKAAQTLSTLSPHDYSLFLVWLDKYGLVDLKKNDTLSILHTASISPYVSTPPKSHRSITCFLRDLILFANITPFSHQATWLPYVEKKLYELYQNTPNAYMLLAEIALFMQKLMAFIPTNQEVLDNNALLHYIQQHDLYNPAEDFAIYENHPALFFVHSFIYQSICLFHLKSEQLEKNTIALAHYYDLTKHINPSLEKSLRIIAALLFIINQQNKNNSLSISNDYLKNHVQQIKIWRQYNNTQLKNWLSMLPVNISATYFHQLLQSYLLASSVDASNTVNTNYYAWIYDAYAMVYETSLQEEQLVSKEI